MKRLTQTVAMLGLAAVATGCATPYMVDRGRDAADIFTAAVGSGTGAKVRVGPIAPGILQSRNYAGLVGGDLFLGYSAHAYEHGGDSVLWPWIFFASDAGNESEVAAQRDKDHVVCYLCGIALPVTWECNPPKYNPAYFTQVEVTLGIGATIKLGVNPGELVDFMLGWTTLDIYGDDLEQRKTRRESNTPSQGMPRPAQQP